jgi:hypothetical protein
VSIALLYLDKARPFTTEDVSNYKNPQALATFAHGVAFAAALNSRLSSNCKSIEEAVILTDELYTVGRCSLNLITSNWVKETYPLAVYELILTLVSDHDPDETHVLIIYLP